MPKRLHLRSRRRSTGVAAPRNPCQYICGPLMSQMRSPMIPALASAGSLQRPCPRASADRTTVLRCSAHDCLQAAGLGRRPKTVYVWHPVRYFERAGRHPTTRRSGCAGGIGQIQKELLSSDWLKRMPVVICTGPLRSHPRPNAAGITAITTINNATPTVAHRSARKVPRGLPVPSFEGREPFPGRETHHETQKGRRFADSRCWPRRAPARAGRVHGARTPVRNSSRSLRRSGRTTAS